MAWTSAAVTATDTAQCTSVSCRAPWREGFTFACSVTVSESRDASRATSRRAAFASAHRAGGAADPSPADIHRILQANVHCASNADSRPRAFARPLPSWHRTRTSQPGAPTDTSPCARSSGTRGAKRRTGTQRARQGPFCRREQIANMKSTPPGCGRRFPPSVFSLLTGDHPPPAAYPAGTTV